MEQTVADRPLSQEQQIDQRQTFNNGSMSSDSHLRAQPSDKRVCRDFVRGKCARGTSCRFDHSESDGQDGYKPYVCNDFLGGRCNRVSCKFLHPGSEISNGCGSNGKEYLGCAANSGKSQLYGESMYYDSRTRSFPREHRSRSPCRKFLNGMCHRGESCPYLHSEYAAFSRSRNDYSSPLQQGVATTLRSPSFGEGHRGKTLWTSQVHGQANEGNATGTRLSSNEYRSKSPCRTSFRGKCYNGANCPYYHPDTYVRPRNEGTPPWHRGPEATSGNPSFGKVDMTSWTSEDHGRRNEGNGRSTGSFNARQRSRSPCRNFIRGRCLRGAYCSYLHTNAGTRDDVSTQRQQQVAVTSENPGFGEGREGIILRTVQEHEGVNMDEDLRSSYFPGGPKSRSPCRKFLSGRCFRGASCHYLHLETHDRSRDIAGYEQNRNLDNVGITSRSWSPDRQRSRPHGDLGADKPRPEVCLKYSRGRCTLGESCKYLHSFHEYAKSASDCSQHPHFESAGAPRNSVGMHQRDPSMMQEELDGSFHEKTRGEYADNAEKPNITDAKDEIALGDQQKCEVSGKAITRNCDFSEADEKNNLCRQSFKRRRSSSRSPSSSRDNIDGRKTRRDESQDNFHWHGIRSGSPLTPRDDFGRRKIRRDESYNNFPRGRCHNVAPFRYAYSHSYRYYMNKEPQSKVAATAVNKSSHDTSEDPNVMETQGGDEVMSHEMQLDQCQNINLDSSTQIVNRKNGSESVKDAVQPSLVDQALGELVKGCSEPVISKGENAVGSVAASDTTCSCVENRSSPMDTGTCASNKDDNAEVNTDLSREKSEKIDSKKQALKTYVRKMDKKSCSGHCLEHLREVIDPSTCQLPSNSAVEASLSQPDMSGARVSDSTQDVVTIGHPVQQLGQGSEVVTKEIQSNAVSVQGTTNDGSSVGYSKSTKQTSQSSVKSAISSPRRNLLVLDVNGLLADIVNVGEVPRGYKPDTIIAMKAVFKRPFCDEFLEFCFDRFDVGVWSSRNKKNVDRVVDFLMYNTKKRLLFCWDQAHCTATGYKTIENREKPLVLKELKKLWEKQEIDLPWEKGFYDETNTVLLDDSPYKALCNPPYTAIFPHAYTFRDVRDRSLGRGGDLRVYLEKLAATDNVPKFIQENPFGQRAITKSNLSWGFYSKIVGAHVPALKVVASRASQQERDAGNSPASSAGDHAEQLKGNADNSHATKSARDHTEQLEGNADKAPGTPDIGAHLDRQDGNVDNTLATKSAATHVNQQEGNADMTSDIEVVAHETQLEGDADNTAETKFVARETQQEGNADSTHATTTSVGDHLN